MRKYLLKEATRASRIAARVSAVALKLPENGPAPIMVSYQGAGEIEFDGEHLGFIADLLGWCDWKREVLSYSNSIDFVKTWEGMRFRISNVAPIHNTPEDVSPAVFEALKANTTT